MEWKLQIAMKDIHKHTSNILSKYKVSLCEHFLMGTVGYRILLPPDELIQTSVSLYEGDPRPQCTPDESMLALQACIQKKWLQVITEELYEQEMNRRHSSGLPEIFDSGFALGVVDFTQSGYLLHRQIIIDIYGMEHVQYNDSGWNIDDIRQEVRIYAPTQEMCVERLEELKQMPSNYIGQLIREVVSSVPEPMDWWKPNRFLSLPHGFYAVMQYQVCDDSAG
jgi:hypothetical protein